jgi:hydrogenase nickel incorporation protein HypA/HybF
LFWRRADVHELSMMEAVVTAVTREVGGARVHLVRLVVGQRAGASPHALRFCFEICARGTVLEGAALDIVETDGDELRLEELEVS